ncbi:MAG: four-carbon acid sugar kinase family protein, partial [Opitutaceae bacterium]|nr:four-carbon acid sugar kinase family protein [Opitutaceae bacterium]
MTAPGSTLHLAYFGDDFTGSTDALESLARAGLRTMLFLDVPTPERLAAFPGLEAVGVAGLTRALAPTAIETALRPALLAMRALRPRHVHYKVCSTFDSSPEIGSIGRAIDIGAETFRAPFVPVVVGAPALGRFCIFGNLFARFGIGSAGAIHRLDRHPSVSRHPVTPMTEADLQLHLARQTTRRIGLVDVLALDLPEAGTRAALETAVAAGAEVVLFDVLVPGHLTRIGELLDPLGRAERPLFSVGSSAVGTALASQWSGGRERSPAEPPRPARPLLVVSGSCSPVTAGQIDLALARGFAGVSLAPDASNEPAASAAALDALRAGKHTVVYSSRSPADQAPAAAPAATLGAALGRIA